MDPNQEKENPDYFFELPENEVIDETDSVEDFIKQLEEKEKDLHITAETTFIEIAGEFDDAVVPDFMRQDKPEARLSIAPSVSESPASLPAVSNPSDEVASLKSKITALQVERAEHIENAERRKRDFEAYKARTERERVDTFQRQLSNLATQMLPALDNLDRALTFASDIPEADRSRFDQFFTGIALVNQQVNEVLSGMGITPIATVGEIFDPHLHEAVALEESDDYPPNVISRELLRGYRIGEKVIRHSMVKVSKPVQQSALSADTAYGEIEFPETPPATPVEFADGTETVTTPPVND